MEMETKNGDPHKKMANGFTSQENHGKLKNKLPIGHRSRC